MKEATLQAVKRAMPGHGRARIHEKLLSYLGIDDQSEVEVSTKAGATLTLTVFADTVVEEGTIRISSEDLEKLNIPDGGEVDVRRKIPLDEQILAAAESTAGQIKEGAQEIGAKLSETAEKIQKGAADTAEQISTKAKELTEKVKEDAKPIGEKVSKAAKSSADAIIDKIPLGKLSADIEKELSAADPEEAKRIRGILVGMEGEKAAVRVQVAAGRTVGNLTIPPEIKLVTVQRDGEILGSDNNIVFKEGDIVYISGSSDAIGFVTRMLEG
ncbi:MAG: hypothetical protein PHD71_04745 [Methanospirillum sp.]|nr:hypothetical protein [Methanospirillum sp.]